MTLAWVVRSLTWRLFAFAVICPSAGSSGHPDNSSMIFYNDTQVQQFERWWSKSKTVPFYLIGLLLPLLNFKSPSFFSKFNILGKVLLRSMSGERVTSLAVRISLVCSFMWYFDFAFCFSVKFGTEKWTRLFQVPFAVSGLVFLIWMTRFPILTFLNNSLPMIVQL